MFNNSNDFRSCFVNNNVVSDSWWWHGADNEDFFGQNENGRRVTWADDDCMLQFNYFQKSETPSTILSEREYQSSKERIFYSLFENFKQAITAYASENNRDSNPLSWFDNYTWYRPISFLTRIPSTGVYASPWPILVRGQSPR
jgi:hypothetical protein